MRKNLIENYGEDKIGLRIVSNNKSLFFSKKKDLKEIKNLEKGNSFSGLLAEIVIGFELLQIPVDCFICI